MELRHLEFRDDLHEIWEGASGGLEALLSVFQVSRSGDGGTGAESVSRVLELVVQRRGATTSAPAAFTEDWP